MTEPTAPPAGRRPTPDMLVDVDRLIGAYYDEHPDPSDPAQAVSFGTSGHRGTSLTGTFTESHIVAISEAIARYRNVQGIDGPLFLGERHARALLPALRTALEVLAANGVEVAVDSEDGYTPTPVISHAILTYNRGAAAPAPTASSSRRRTTRPRTAASSTTRPTAARPTPTSPRWIQTRANELLRAGQRGRQAHALRAGAARATTRRHDYRRRLRGRIWRNVVDMDAIRGREAEARRRSAGRRERRLLGADRRALRAGPRRS